MTFAFRAPLVPHAGQAAWYFLTLPTDVADEIADITEGSTRGFGSVRVRVTVGTTSWDTSIFPDKAAESFVLPVKKKVRVDEKLSEGDIVDVTLQLLDH